MIKWAYILVGENNTGKTTLQKEIISLVAFADYEKLKCNLLFNVITPIGSKNTKTISIMNRSFQEKLGDYQSLPNFFNSHFQEADACILSSHIAEAKYKATITDMIVELKKRFYNVCGVFFENSISHDKEANQEIALLDWDEKYSIKNPVVDNDSWQHYIRVGAVELTNHILSKV